MAKISVVIVSWNVADSLDKCLQSVYATNHSGLEVWVIDNNSTDDSVEVVKKYRRAKLIKNAVNIGFPRAVNQGLKRAMGDYILILNPDTRIPKNFFSQAVDFLENYSDAGVMGPKLVNPDGSTQGSVFREPSIFGLNNKYAPRSRIPVAVDAISGSCMFLSSKVVKKIGYMTEKVFMYYEDLDYCRRIRETDLKVYFNPNIQVVHEHGSSAKQNLLTSDWRGQLWKSSLWYNGSVKHYLMWLVSIARQKIKLI